MEVGWTVEGTTARRSTEALGNEGDQRDLNIVAWTDVHGGRGEVMLRISAAVEAAVPLEIK